MLLPLVTGNFAMQMARWRKRWPLTCFASQSKGSVTDLYRLLGISASSSKAEIRAAYISRIKVMHPDVSADDDATEDAVALNAAYTALMVGMHLSGLTTSPICYHQKLVYFMHQCLHLEHTELLQCKRNQVDNTALHNASASRHSLEAFCSNVLVQEQHVDYDEEDDLLDVFDITEAEPDLLFINPFGCQVDPLRWRELQVC